MAHPHNTIRSRLCLAALIPCAMAFAAAQSAIAARIIYVNVVATGNIDGASWPNAYTDLQDAVADSGSPDCPCEIWIAEGTYKPDRGTGNRQTWFELPGTVAIYGGFEGWETSIEDRVLGLHETILSGDLNGDDLPIVTTSNCCVARPTELPGGCDNAACEATVGAQDPTCVAHHWHSGCEYWASILCCDLCRPTRCDNSWHVLRARVPGSNVVLDGLTIASAEAPGSNGGGVETVDATLQIRSCHFYFNDANEGSAIFMNFSTLPSGPSSVSNCEFTDNWSDDRSQTAVYMLGSPITVADCVFTNNYGGGATVLAHNGAIDRCLFANNSSEHYGGGLTATGTMIRACMFLNNRGLAGGAVEGGGATGNSMRIEHCKFLGNSAQDGGAIYSRGVVSVVNTLFTGNHADFFNSAIQHQGKLTVTGSTFCNNSAGVGGCLEVGPYGPGLLYNNIFWNNVDEYGTSAGVGSFGTLVDVRFNILQGETDTWPDNLDSDPLFSNPIGSDGIPGTLDDDLRLQPGSPAINAGDPNYAPTQGETDLDGHARILCGRTDMGAYEFGIGDYDCDQSVNLTDFANWMMCATPPLAIDPPLSPLIKGGGSSGTLIKGAGSGGAPVKGGGGRGTLIKGISGGGIPRELKYAARDGGQGPPYIALVKGRGSGPFHDARSLENPIDNRQPPIDNPCTAFDFNADGDIDLHDFSMLQQVFVRP